MTKFTKLLTLIPLVALGAACNGASPTAPDMVAPDASAAYDSSKAIGPSADSCKNITGVELTLVPTPQRSTVIKATYVGLGSLSTRCAAPVWTSNPQGALISNSNPFKTGVKQSVTSVTVFATAPNGVQGHIQIGPVYNSQAIGPVACNITGIELKLVPTPQHSTLIRATYVGFGGTGTRCAAPVWTSDPQGALIANINPFKTGVNQVFKSVTVFATAPNGVRGRISVTP